MAEGKGAEVNISTFKLDGKTYRFAIQYRREREAGYLEDDLNAYNIVQEKRWWGWKTVDEEYIPAWAWIAQATLGSADWRSKMVERWKERIENDELSRGKSTGD